MCEDPQSATRQLCHQCLLELFGSACVKAAQTNMMLKLTLGLNFTNPLLVQNENAPIHGTDAILYYQQN